MMTGIVWAAVSSADQVENVSLENQIRMAQDHAQRHGVAITTVLIVPGKSRHVVLFNRAATIDDLRVNGLGWLTNDDVRTANVWLRKHFRVWVEARQVVRIELV